MADRLANEKELVENVVRDGLDKVDALQLNHDGKSHPVTFTFAMALGAGIGEKTQTQKASAWLQYSAINNSDSENRSFATSLALSELRKTSEENLLSQDDMIFGIAAEYANTGFAKIREMIPNFDEYDEDDFVLQLIELMDEKYDEIIGDQSTE